MSASKCRFNVKQLILLTFSLFDSVPQVQPQLQQQPQQRGKMLNCGGILLDPGRFTLYSDDFPVGYKLMR